MADFNAESLNDPVKRLNPIFEEMWEERGRMLPRWKDVANLMCPTRPSFLASGTDKSRRTNKMIVDGTQIRAAGIMASGLIASTANPGSEWFEVGPSTRALGEAQDAKLWLREARDTILDVYERSNYYTNYGQALADELRFATGAYFQFEHLSKIVRFECLPVGGYGISQDAEGRVDTICREMSMTVRQMYEKFGQDALSERVIRKLRAGRLQDAYIIRHLVEPNPRPLEKSPFARDLPYREFYWEYEELGTGGRGRHNPGPAESQKAPHVLKRGGYHEFPAVVLRWQRNPEDVWGTECPAFQALGDMRELQTQVRRRANAMGKQVNPPMNIPVSQQGRPYSLAEGAKNYMESASDAEIARPSYENRFNVNDSTRMIDEKRRHVESFFGVDFFLALLGDQRTQPPTAEEVRARQQEKAALIGPIAEKNADEGHDPTINRTLAILIRRSIPDWRLGRDGLLPIPPASLQGHEPRVVYVSEVDRIRKLGSIEPIERHLGFVTSLAAFDSSVLDTVNLDEAARINAEANAAHPSVSRPPEEIAQIRAERQAQLAAQRDAEMAAQQASTAKDLSKSNVNGQNALEALVGAGG